MVRHWLSTPVNSYLGSGYGSDPQSLLQMPMMTGVGDAFIAKMVNDVPILQAFPRGSLNIYFQEIGNDSKKLIIDISGSLISVDSQGTIQ